MNSRLFLIVGSLFAAILLITVLAPPHPSTASDVAQPRPIFVNLTTGEDDLQKASMGLTLARNSLASGRDVTVFLNVHAIALADNTRGDIRIYKSDVDVHSFMNELIADGAAIIACPYCTEMNGLLADDLLAGVQLAGIDNFFPPLDSAAAVFSY